MSLALVALLGAPANAGTWVFALQPINPTPTGNPGPRWTAPSPALGGNTTSYNTWISSTSPTTVSLTLCITATWQATNAQDSAPTQVPVLETASAGYGVTGGGQVNWAPNDGLGDTPVFNYNSVQRTTNGMTQGTHLLICDGSSKTFTFTRTVSVGSVGTDPAFVGSATVSYSVQIDTKSLLLYRDNAHNETLDASGTLHGDTRYSYLNGIPTNPNLGTTFNTQKIHPLFEGNWSPNPSWQWTPQAKYPYTDNANTHFHVVDTGTIWADGQSDGWSGSPDAPKTITISYTATDANNGASATAYYILTEHDQYENWHRVSSQGGPIAPNGPGDFGSVVLLATSSPIKPNALPLLTPEAVPVPLIVDGLTIGGISGGAGVAWALIPEALDPPLWPAVLLSLTGLALQTVASIPVDTQPLSPNVTFNAAFLQTAYNNYVYNQTALPGEEVNSNLVDTAFAQYLAKNPDFTGYVNGNYAGVTITTTLGQQMLNYYFQADKYDNGGFLTHTAPGSASVPGNYVWSYLWDCTGAPTTPGVPKP